MTKTLTGKVISTKMDKTLVVSVERRFRHAKYQKVITRHKKYKAHNELPKIKTDDYVRIEETRPLSREIRFAVVEKLAGKNSK